MTDWLHGVDVSHYQSGNPRIPWAEIGRTSHFAIVKASDGKGIDKACVGLVERCRDLGLRIGLYHFFRESVPLQLQLDAFYRQAEAISLGPGDLLPVLDLEDPSATTHLTKAASDPARDWCAGVSAVHGGAIVYTTQMVWAARLGSPSWVLDLPLWVAHYRGKPGAPATPGQKPWRLWQYAVHPYAPGVYQNDFKNSAAIDHNWALSPLPLIGASVTEQPAALPTESIPPPLYLTALDWEELRAARDAAIKEPE